MFENLIFASLIVESNNLVYTIAYFLQRYELAY